MEYSLPVSKKLDPREMTEKEFNALFGEKDIIHSLVGGIKMSGKYLELACTEAGVDKTGMQPGKKLFGAVKKLLEDKQELSATLDEQYSTIEADSAPSDKVARKLKQQEDAIVTLEKRAQLEVEKGDAIYKHWQTLDSLVGKVDELRKAGKGYDEINQMLAGTASINKKTKKMTIKL